MKPTDLTITEAGAALRDGSLTSMTLTEAHIELITRRDPEIRAFAVLDADGAMAAARQADLDLADGKDRGPLHGIPFAVKDLIDIAGLPTTCGSHHLIGSIADKDAAVITHMRSAGAVPLGKLVTYEFALTGPSFDGPFPPAVNPWDVDHITGGSSSGSAAAVSAGLVRVAIGTDTGGSIRSPASFCGVVGLKPSYDRVSRDGVFPLSPTLDHVGPIAATVSEAAMMLDAMAPGAGSGASALLGSGANGLSIAYARDWFANDPATNLESLRAMDAAVSAFTLAGARVELITMPDYELAEAAGAIILHHEALSQHINALQAGAAGYGRQARQSLAAGVGLGDADIAAARNIAIRFRDGIDDILARFDAIVTVTTLTPAPPLAAFKGDQSVWTPMRTLPFNLTGHPVVNVPIGLCGRLPIGMQIIGKNGDEATICRLGASFEAATDHSVQRPYFG